MWFWNNRILSVSFDGPWMDESSQFFTSWLIEIKSSLRMGMQKCWWNIIWNFSFNWSFHNISFSLRPGHYNDSLCLLNGMNSHCNGCFWNIICSTKSFWSISSGESVQINKSCATVNWWWRFIESNVSCSSNTKDLNVNSTKLFYLFFIIWTKFSDIWSFDFSIRNVHVLFWNVNMMEKVVPHVKVVWFRIIMFDWVIFIKIECDNVFKWKTFFFMEPYELSVH